MERRHDSSHKPTPSGNGVPSYFNMQQMYWAAVGAVIAAATLANIMNKVIAAQRFSDKTLAPSKPKSFFFRAYATGTAMVREFSNAGFRPLAIGKSTLHTAPVGRVSILLANLLVVMVLCFYKLNTMDQWSWETVGYRTGFIAIGQLPLVFLLASKNNIIGFLTGSSYERLNWLHRWTARTLWLTATVHMGFWFRSWGRYDYILVKLTKDPLTQRGFAAWCVLTCIVVISMAPIRRLSYEVFVLSHIATFSGFIAAVWFHAPAEVKAWVWIPIGLLVLDRVVRYAFMALANIPLLSLHRRPASTMNLSKWSLSATFTPLPGNVTKITIQNPTISWKPGQHVLLSCHSVLPLQSHPFTIASIPSDDKLEFFVRAEKGGTKKIFDHVSSQSQLREQENSRRPCQLTKSVIIDGPYGRIRTLRQFDSVVFIAGSMGATFTMPLMRDIVEGWKNENLGPETGRTSFALTKRIRFIWIVRSQSHLTWFMDQLQELMRDIDRCAGANSLFNKTRSLEISIYTTCGTESCPTLQSPLSARLASMSKLATAEKQPAVEMPARQSKPNSCCCARKVTDETAPSTPCLCSDLAPAPPPSLPTTTVTEIEVGPSEKGLPTPTSYSQPPLDSRITIVSGRPDTRTIIRSVLEQAEGESGVVVCGPSGLNADVRRNVVSLSDERAVHKGTGAQGIYLHVEEFGF
ncbi:predicted protein [Uncinocarpus reesii 1704]|uniref:ferric-chelate reductase (NADPH) n=1 Tax=Uncinocarpus reesii (strain UAMH 1704) TaxID=336963 RepID=C4JU54_UNCRE|nr:uncharacterized protein UREG_05993 [Uncinocarpus reesii 1704]EEP81151.1 predicted protein [Uncinocarpus reesii 1704]